MPFSRWIIPVVFGLAASLAASLGEAQEQAGDPRNTSASQENPTQTFPVPLPVDIVEDQGAAEARQRREEEARDREIRDLAAQEGMNAATQSIERATQDMRDYALYSAVLVGLGTFMLGITLWLTRQANRAAQAAVDITREIGQAQVRAYISITDGHVMQFRRSRQIDLSITVRNAGSSPARNMTIKHGRDPRTYDRDGRPFPVARFAAGAEREISLVNISGNHAVSISFVFEDREVMFPDAPQVTFGTEIDIEYDTVFENLGRCTERFVVVVSIPRGDLRPEVKWPISIFRRAENPQSGN